jgi:hypothetical protein
MPDMKEHPDYAEGFFDAQEGTPLLCGMSEEYTAGWKAFYRCKEIMERAGLTEGADGRFGRKFTVTP